MLLPNSQKSYLIGLIGAGIQASRTPRMHEQEAACQGLRYVYKSIDLEKLGVGVEALPELLTAAHRMGFDGLNITHPCKQAILPLLTDLSDEARAIGAVNTVVLREGELVGHNTDASGFAESFKRGLPGVMLDDVVLLGAGGAGAAVAHTILALGAEKLSLFDVQAPRAETLAEQLRRRFGRQRVRAVPDLASALTSANGLIHATPSGMATHPGLPLAEKLLRPDLWVAEIVYFPLETELLRIAKQLGCRTLDGGGMAVFQAVEAFRLFTGMQPDADRMRRHFDSM